MRQTFVLIVAVLCVVATASSAGAVVIADSAADFSFTQGQDGWYYGYVVPSVSPNFLEMTHEGNLWFGAGWAADPDHYFTILADTWAHPQGTTVARNGYPTVHEEWAVRRWVSDVDSTVTISGILAKMGVGGGDGVIGSVVVDGNDLWSQHIDYNDTTGVQFDLDVNLHKGSTVDFVLAPGANQLWDTSRFEGKVEIMPEPASMLLVGAGLVGLILKRRRGR